MKRIIKSRLRILLAERDWTQKDLVERSSLTNRAVSDFVNDRQQSYSRETINELIRVLDLKEANELFSVTEIEE